MRVILIATVAVTAAINLGAAQQQSTTSTPLRTEIPVALAGCTPVGATSSLSRLPTSSSTGSTQRSPHQLRLKVLNRPSRGIPATGGFVPTTDIAAQAGSLDQVFSARSIAMGEQNRIPMPPHRTTPFQAIGPRPSHVTCPSP